MRFSFVILIIIGCFLSCSRELLPTNTIQLIGHGGEGFSNISALYAPNSVGSMKRALDFYALDGIEVDVRFTADSSLIVFHDEFLEQKTQCKGILVCNQLNEGKAPSTVTVLLGLRYTCVLT